MISAPLRTSHAALLFQGSFYGTVATARCLAPKGIRVVLADTRRWQRAWGSRHVSDRVLCPPVSDVEGFVAWLGAFGRRRPGMVLFPASDELAWVFALHADDLAAAGLVPYVPSRESISRILDKWRLTEACRRVGFDTPATYCPDDAAGIEALSRELTVPVMIKPRSQVLLASGSKGVKVDEPKQLPDAYRRYMEENPPAEGLAARDPALGRPIIQEYRPEAARSIYSLAGFIDRSGKHAVMRASRKILQRPRRLGIGLCFEAAPVDPALAEAVRKLCGELGYFGIFEVELVEADGKHLLIDFNPRPYSQMAFEIARGVPMPYLAYLDATGQDDLLAREVEAAANRPGGATAYAHQLLLSLVIAGQAVHRPLGGAEPEPWLRWVREQEVADAVLDRGDLGPVVLDVLAHLEQAVKHPRSFLRSLTR